MNKLGELRQVFIALIASAFFLAPRLAGAAETAKLTPLRLAYSAISVNQAIPWIAVEAGHLKNTASMSRSSTPAASRRCKRCSPAKCPSPNRSPMLASAPI